MKSSKVQLLSKFTTLGCVILFADLLTGCATFPGWLSSAGPSREQIEKSPTVTPANGIRLVDVNESVVRKLQANKKQTQFSDTLGLKSQANYVIGSGDVVEVAIWEAPPAALFGGATIDAKAGVSTTHMTNFPEQMVSTEGFINIPFAGQIQAAGRSPQQIESEIVKRLNGKANQPQVLVRVIRNNTANVTVVGEVTSSVRMPLTAKGERLLDALAAAGGVRQPINKMTLQVSRDGEIQSMPLEAIIRDPKQNIVLQPGDVVTSLFQPLSFTVLGATGKNEEVNFEATGITLAQALARSGGLQDARADAQGVFLFRFESPDAVDATDRKSANLIDGKVPVVYKINLKDPATFFVAQQFTMQNKDVLYVANAASNELQKFLNILTSSIFSVANVINATR